MPGAWNGWTNPPTNLALASYTQVTGGLVTKISTGTHRWQTILQVAASGGNIVGGTYEWLFTSGSTGSPWGNKWAGTTVTMNTLQSYTWNNGPNNSITVVNGKWYTMNWKDNGYTGTQAIFMETSAAPVNITDVTVPVNVAANSPATITITTSSAPCAEELFYVLYSTNNFTTSQIAAVSMTGNSGSATIPGQLPGAVVKYYVFSTTVASPVSEYDMFSIKINNNSEAYYSYTTNGLSSEAEILTFTFPEQTGAATITSLDATVEIEVAFGTNVASLTPSITVSIGAIIDPASGVTRDFSSPVTYLVTAQDGTTTKTWTVTVTVADPPLPNYGLRDDGGILLPTFTYWYSGQPADITEKGAEFEGKALGEISSLNIKGSSIKTWKSGSGDVTGTRFHYKVWATGDVEPTAYTIRNVNWTSNDGDGNQTWASFGDVIAIADGLIPGDYYLKINFSVAGTGVPGDTTDGPFSGTFTIAERSNEAEILTFTLPEQASPAVINSADATVAIEVAIGTNLSSLTPTITISEGAKIDPESGVTMDFSSPVQYTVTSESEIDKIWTVTVTEEAPPSINWANLQWPGSGQIEPNQEFFVYAQAYVEDITPGAGQGTGLQAWIGYNTENDDPATWTNWIVADYFGESGNNDEFRLNLGALMSVEDTFYYASRFKLNDQDYVYGGFQGGFWNGTTNISGELIVKDLPEPEISWANLQYPASGTIQPLQSYNVYGQVFADGITTGAGQGAGIQAWVGLSSTNTDPSGWTNWVVATYNADNNNNDEYLADIGVLLPATGTYYYATRFQLNTGDYVYGGYSESGGGLWDGTSYISGLLTVTNDKILNINDVFIEGLYSEAGTMNQAQSLSGAQFEAGIADQVTIELHDASDYDIIIYSVGNVNLSTTGNISVSIPGENSGQYYLTIKGRNILETTSALPVSFATATISHSYSNPANVFGSNLKTSGDSYYLIYSGDLNSDGYINNADMVLLNNEVELFAKGYNTVDLNGDGTADGLDMIIMDNNAAIQITRMIPE